MSLLPLLLNAAPHAPIIPKKTRTLTWVVFSLSAFQHLEAQPVDIARFHSWETKRTLRSSS